jgi:hypothetical protein
VDFRALAEEFEASGGDIKNAVLKAAQMATAEPGPDAEKKIHQQHFAEGIRDVLAAKRVMEQSLFGAEEGPYGPAGPVGQLVTRQESLEDNLSAFAQRLIEVEDQAASLPEVLERMASSQTDTDRRLAETLEVLATERAASDAAWRRQARIALGLGAAALAAALGALGIVIF